ncbi:hypothetical protein DL768_005760 [Monosporascus sp. mg162]|nr:hypothetical protein DL768_005760 [Monosporascus sp. mg162]
MIVAPSVVELTGTRVVRYQLPRGTPSRIVNLRQHRCFHHGTPSRVRHYAIVLKGSCSSIKSVSGHGYAMLKKPVVTITDSEYALIQDLLDRSPGGLPKVDNVQRASNIAGYRHVAQSIAPLAAAPRGTDGTNGVSAWEGQSVYQQLPKPFRKAIQAMQQKDTRKLLISLRQIAMLPEDELHNAIASMPRSTFTELLRSLDPFTVSKDADPTNGAYIAPGMFTMLNMESTIDDWGVRKLYVRLLERMLVLMKALRATGQTLNAEEYTYLIRCAGAAFDITTAKWLWRDMDRCGTTFWRQTGLYREYVKARFLTDAIYTGYDKTRVMVLPRNLHRSKLLLAPHRLRQLERLRLSTRLRKFRFGLNKLSDHAEDLTRILRKTAPPLRLFLRIHLDGHITSERLLCHFMIAFARTGSLRFIGSRILEDFFAIRVEGLNLDKFTAGPANWKFRAPFFRIRPTAQLMHAVVESYCCNCEIALAVQIVDQISSKYRIPIPPEVWRNLLEWTHIASSPPISTAWKKAGMPWKVPASTAVEMVWSTMTGPPYNVQPTFKDYGILIKNLLGRGQLERAIPYLREARRLYDARCHEFEDSVFEYIQALRDGADATRALHRHECARFAKQAAWYDMQTWCRRLLLAWRPLPPRTSGTRTGAGPQDFDQRFSHERSIPDFVREFRDFVPNPALYRTPSGYVRLADPAVPFARSVFVRRMPLDVPMLTRRPLEGGGNHYHWQLRRVRQRKVAVLSARSLAAQTASRLDPLTLLSGDLDTFRTARLPKRRGASPRGQVVDGNPVAGADELEYGDYDD